jgi:hypothetical protein
MGREIVYCWKCATRLQGADFENAGAFRVGDKVSCPECIDELVADLSAEEQEAILNPPKKREKTQSIPREATGKTPKAAAEGTASIRRGNTGVRTRSGSTGPVTKVRTGSTGPVPTGGSTGVRKRVTASVAKVQPPSEEDEDGAEGGGKPPMDEKKKRLILIAGGGGGLFLIIVVLLILVLTKKDKVKPTASTTEEDGPKKPAPTAVVESPKVQQVKALLKEGFELAKDPAKLGPQLQKFEEAAKLAEGTGEASNAEAALDEARLRVDKAVAALDAQVKDQWTAMDFKPVLETYEKAKASHDFPQWKEKIENKLRLTKNKMDDVVHEFKKKSENARLNNDEDTVKACKETIAKWESPEHTEKFEKFLALMASAGENPDPSKTPEPVRNAPAVKPLSPAMKAFMPVWQEAIAPALSRDFGAAANAMGGAGAKADSDEAKKAAADDAQALKDLGELLPEVLKQVAQTAKLQTFTLEYQDQPGTWKKVTGKTLKVEPTRIEFQPDTPKDAKPLPPIFIEISDLNAGSLAELYKAKKKTLAKKEADLLTRFALLEGAAESAKATGGTAPDRYWHFAPEARAAAPKPNSREFEARTLFHQSEFEWRKPLTKYNAVEKSKLLMTDYTSTAIVKKYQAQIAPRAEMGKEYTFLPSQLTATGDFNQFKLTKKDDLAWLAAKDIDFQNSLYNYVEAEFIALPNVGYRCWVYAGGCCQEVWNGSYQLTEGTTTVKGKSMGIDPGDKFAAQFPMPSGLKKEHKDHLPKGVKLPDFAKTPAKWDWVSIPLPKTFATPGSKVLRIMTNQAGFAVKYVVISSTKTKAPDEAATKDFAKDAASGGGPGKADVKGTPVPKEWLIIGPFPEGLSKEEGPETNIDLAQDLKGKTGNVKWKIFNSGMKGPQIILDWEKGVFNPKDNVSAYALIHVKAPAATDCRLFLSHDDGGRVWLNGARVHDNNKNGVVKADEFNVALHLEEGWNRLLFKVTTNGAGFGLMLRITDNNKAPVPGLEYSPYGDSLEPQ